MIMAFLHNGIVIVVFGSWLVAQTLKVLLRRIKTGKWDISLLWNASGMPSSHSASVWGTSLYIGLTEGFGSPVYGVAFLFAMIVMYDAMGVRRAVGQQAEVINYLMELRDTNDSYDHCLLERVGHTPAQVLGGVVVGTLLALLVYYV